MIKNILCPVDRSPSSLEAFSYAIALARWQGARLNLLEVIEAAVPTGGSRVDEDDRLARLLPRSTSDGPGAQPVITVSKPSAAIVKFARARSPDLVVLGVSGRGATDVALLGSTTHHVIREGTHPVLTVRTIAR